MDRIVRAIAEWWNARMDSQRYAIVGGIVWVALLVTFMIWALRA